MTKTRILITFDAMRYPNTGLFFFGKSLGKALVKNNGGRFNLTFFLYPNTTEFNEDDVKKDYLKKYHKLFYINFNKINLFHFTDQMPRLYPQKVIGKKIMTIHDINQLHEDISTKQVNKYLKRLEKSIKTCDKLVTISHFAARDIVARFPSAAGKLSVIYNGADKLTVPTGHQPTYLPKSSFLFTIGILSAKKNFEVLPSLLAGNNYELIISGIKTSYEALIIKQAHKYGCENRVKITGTISDDDKAWYYKNCEAFVFPSLAEGFGLPIIEAMHFGKPVFCSTCTSLPEIAGDAAYYFDNFDSAAMQRVLREGLADFRENNREAMVMNHAAQYSWDQTAQQYLQLYQSCLT